MSTLNLPPYGVLNDSYAFLQRLSFNRQANGNVVPLSAIASAEVLIANVVLARTQAMRIVKGSAGNCYAGAGAGTNLSCQSCSVELFDSLGNQCAAWPGFYSGDTLGGNGAFAQVGTDEVIQASDFLALGGDGSTFQLFFGADVLNKDGAASHTFNLIGAALIEIWELTTTSRMRG
jgi:hypothetical protein